MAAQLQAMLSILGTWLILSAVFCGIGLLLRRLFGLQVRGAYSWFVSFWLGWAVSLALLQLWHLWLPIRWPALLFISCLGAFGLILSGRGIWRAAVRGLTERPLLLVLPTLLVVWIAYRALGPFSNYDSGLYHLQSVRWAQAYPIVRGLGNLHGRLAFNSSHFLYAAMLDVGPWTGRSQHIASGLLMAMAAAECAVSVSHLFGTDREQRAYHLLQSLLLAPIIIAASAGDVSSLSTDVPIFALTIVVAGLLLRLLVWQDEPLERAFLVTAIVGLAAAGITVKLSFAAFGAVAALIAAAVWWLGDRREARLPKMRPLWATAAFGVLLLVPWMVRGVILSGYIAYPSTLGAFPVAWRVPRSLVISEANWARSWPRTPNVSWAEVLGNWDWLASWVKNLPSDVLKALEITVGGLVASISVAWTARPAGRRNGLLWLMLLPPAASLVFWFVSAPNPRFAQASFWMLAAASVTIAAAYLLPAADDGSTKLTLFGLWIVLFLFVSPVRQPLFVSPGQDGGFAAPDIGYRTLATQSGVQVNMPQKGDQCWDAPLPCTPYFRPELRLLSGDVGGGFALDPTVVYMDMHGTSRPLDITVPTNLGVGFLSGWYSFESEASVRWMETPAKMLIYTERAATVIMTLTPAMMRQGTGFGDSGKLSIAINGASWRTLNLHSGQPVQLSLALKRDFSVLTLAFAGGNFVPKESIPGSTDERSLSVAFSGMRFEFGTNPGRSSTP